MLVAAVVAVTAAFYAVGEAPVAHVLIAFQPALTLLVAGRLNRVLAAT